MTTPELDREILRDLIPIYLAGEASAPTRQLIEAQIASDPSFAELIDPERLVRLPKLPPPAPEAELKAFLLVRRRLLFHHLMLAMALLFTFLFALSMGLLLETRPEAGAVSFLLGSVFWLVVYLTGRSLK